MGVQPYFAGIPTFFRAPSARIDDLSKGDIAVLGAPFDSSNTYGRVGTRYGPRAVREDACYFHSFYASMPDRKVVDLDSRTEYTIPEDLPLYDVGDSDCYPVDIDATTKSIQEDVASIVAAGAFPITIGGDHWVGYPAWKGAAEGLARSGRLGDEPLGMIQVDSHTDLFDEMLFTGRRNHASFARRVTEDPDGSTDRMVWIGLNGRLVSREQYDFATSNDLHMVLASELRGPGWEDAVDTAFAKAADGRNVYATIDIDAVDGSEAAGTGSAIFDGISASRFVEIVEKLADLPNLVGLDLCEVAPGLDPSGRTSRLAALALVSFLGARLFETRPLDGNG